MYYTDDPVRDAERYFSDCEAELEKLPKCSYCGRAIQTEKCYEIADELYCPKCMKKEFEKDTDNFIR